MPMLLREDNLGVHKSSPVVVIYFDWHLDIRAGGPPGYLANLHSGLDRLNCKLSSQVFFLCKDVPASVPKARFSRFPSLKKFLREKIIWFNKRIIRDVDFFMNQVEMCIPDDQAARIDWGGVSCIHTHTVIDTIKAKNFTKKIGREDIKIMFTSHTPEAPAIEQRNLMVESGCHPVILEKYIYAWEKLQEKAFEASDILLFPSIESMEPYYETIKNFNDWIFGKTIFFVPTGAKSILNKNGNNLRDRLGLQNKKIVAFVGRHNAVKGYDLLKAAGKKLLKRHNDLYFLIAGNQSLLFPPLKHDRWIELGWVNPGELLQSADLFVLPNRRTYFDLILIEALSTGVSILASNTGGNKTVHEISNGVIELFENDLNTLITGIEKFLNGFRFDRDEVLKVYEHHFTIDKFSERYIDVVSKIVERYE